MNRGKLATEDRVLEPKQCTSYEEHRTMRGGILGKTQRGLRFEWYVFSGQDQLLLWA